MEGSAMATARAYVVFFALRWSLVQCYVHTVGSVELLVYKHVSFNVKLCCRHDRRRASIRRRPISGMSEIESNTKIVVVAS